MTFSASARPGVPGPPAFSTGDRAGGSANAGDAARRGEVRDGRRPDEVGRVSAGVDQARAIGAVEPGIGGLGQFQSDPKPSDVPHLVEDDRLRGCSAPRASAMSADVEDHVAHQRGEAPGVRTQQGKAPPRIVPGPSIGADAWRKMRTEVITWSMAGVLSLQLFAVRDHGVRRRSSTPRCCSSGRRRRGRRSAGWRSRA